jgi:hydrophobe/amphiphile efflux-1 (HAE1) family protein
MLGGYSETLPIDQVNDYLANHLAQKLASLPGVGEADLKGEQKPAIRVQIEPALSASQGLSLEEIRTALAAASLNAPKGALDGAYQTSTLASNDQLQSADDYREVIVAWRNGAPVRIKDIGTAVDSIEDTRSTAWTNDHRGVLVGIERQPGANVIATVEGIKAKLPELLAAIPSAIHVDVVSDRTAMIRASVADVETALCISIALVIGVIFVFLRKIWATVIPGLSVPLSLLGAFSVMSLCGYSLDNLSLIALTIAVGFVVDDAIVMIENIVRHMEQGKSAYEAAVFGAREIVPTIVSMTLSLIAVFIPLLLMGGVVGRLFREFAVTASAAIVISGMVSLTMTPAMCARFLGNDEKRHGKKFASLENFFRSMTARYGAGLRWSLGHRRAVGVSVLVTVAVTAVLFLTIPKGFFPQQDIGTLRGSTQAAPDISFAEFVTKQRQVNAIILADPDVQNLNSYIDSGATTGRLTVDLKPFGERKSSATDIIARLRPKFAAVSGVDVRMLASQEITIGARGARTQYHYTLQAQNIDELSHWANVMFERLEKIPALEDLATDQQNTGAQTFIEVDRDAAARLGVTQQQIDDTLYDAFGQRQIGTTFTQLNQYKVVLEIDPRIQGSVNALDQIYVKATGGAHPGTLVPLRSFASIAPTNTALAINHQGQFPSTTLSFNLARGVALSEAIELVKAAEAEVRLPASVVPAFQGTAQAFQESLVTMPYLIAAAIIAVYLVLGVLYESYIHPLTILSTIPSAGVGALLMLRLFDLPLDMVGLIGILLLIGIVKKNAIMMIDFALEAERSQKLAPVEAIYRAAMVRFRPIMMTSLCALLGGVPLILFTGAGSDLRRPLGVAIVGGLALSQLLTLFTTPVVYLYLHGLAGRFSRRERKLSALTQGRASSDSVQDMEAN